MLRRVSTESPRASATPDRHHIRHSKEGHGRPSRHQRVPSEAKASQSHGAHCQAATRTPKSVGRGPGGLVITSARMTSPHPLTMRTNSPAEGARPDFFGEGLWPWPWGNAGRTAEDSLGSDIAFTVEIGSDMAIAFAWVSHPRIVRGRTADSRSYPPTHSQTVWSHFLLTHPLPLIASSP